MSTAPMPLDEQPFTDTEQRFARTMDEAFRTPAYAQAIWLDNSLTARLLRWVRRLINGRT